jgi:hypothetical protein
LVVVAGNLTGIRYRDEIVQPYVIPFIHAQVNNVTFQQNNARPHVTRFVRDYLTQQNVDLLPWPAVSPDLSSIEHVSSIEHIWLSIIEGKIGQLTVRRTSSFIIGISCCLARM